MKNGVAVVREIDKTHQIQKSITLVVNLGSNCENLENSGFLWAITQAWNKKLNGFGTAGVDQERIWISLNGDIANLELLRDVIDEIGDGYVERKPKDLFLTTAFGFQGYGFPIWGADKNFENLLKIKNKEKYLKIRQAKKFFDSVFWAEKWMLLFSGFDDDDILTPSQKYFDNLKPSYASIFHQPLVKYIGGYWRLVTESEKYSYTEGYWASSSNNSASTALFHILPYLFSKDDTDEELLNLNDFGTFENSKFVY
jgi:hypothetical protein